jgi:hypothetical protein
MIVIGRNSSLGLLALFASTIAAVAQPAPMRWPEAVAPLAGERSRAETCVALLKRYGTGAEIEQNKTIYVNARANADAVIVELISVLSDWRIPASISNLQDRVRSSVSGLAEFCSAVGDLVPDTTGKKWFWAEIAKSGIPLLEKHVSDAVSDLYNNHRIDDVLTRRTIQTQLEAARWPTFASVIPIQ